MLRSLGAGWSTVLVPVDLIQPLKLTRNFGRPTLRALYINDPITQSEDVFNLVLQLDGEPDFTGAYRIEPGQYGQSQLFSTDALLTLLRVLEEGDL